MDSSVMQVNEQSFSFELTQDAEYQEAKDNGFEGSLEDYIQYRDYT